MNGPMPVLKSPRVLLMLGAHVGCVAEALDPYLDQELPQREALDRANHHLREFMFAQIEQTRNEDDIYLFLEYV